MKLLAILLLSILLIGTASAETKSKVPMPTVTMTSKPVLIEFVGTIKYIPVEGGFYGIVAKDGTKFNPINLSKKLQKNGLKVKCQAELRNDLVTTQMWGKTIEIKKAEKLQNF